VALASARQAEPVPTTAPAASADVVRQQASPPQLLATHHAIFRRYKPWIGKCPAGFLPTFSGSLIRREFYTGWLHEDATFVTSDGYPKVDEELLEWTDLLEAISDSGPEFTMIELGGGFGRWVVAAACTVRGIDPSKAVRLIAVEAEPEHFQMMRQHFHDNGLDPSEHRLLWAAVTVHGSEATFLSGRAREWYGQEIAKPGSGSVWPDVAEISVPAIQLSDILESEKMVDLIDMDIQGIEGEIIETSLAALSAKVRRLHIGTHAQAVEDQIFATLRSAGWLCCHAFRSGMLADTEYGQIQFGDGVQSWLNPRLF
jgi:FkbM family methyltransferase